jgi:hypothetical protein
MLIYRLLLIFSLIVLSNSCKNNEHLNGSFQLSVTTDTTRASIGDLISYKIITQNIGDKYFKIENPQFTEPLELRSSTLLYDKKEKVTGAEFIFSVWDTGMVSIPPITINLFNSDSLFDFAMETDSISIEVISIVNSTDNQEMKPIKGPIAVKNVFPIRMIILIILLLTILFGLYFIYGKRDANIYDEKKVETNKDPADIIALKKLESLSKESYDQTEKVKEFYIKISHILREYIENSVYIKSLEMTTEEIGRHRVSFPFNKEEIDNLLDILNRADLSKYAKSNPKKNICDYDLEAGKNFIINTTSSWKVLKK